MLHRLAVQFQLGAFRTTPFMNLLYESAEKQLNFLNNYVVLRTERHNKILIPIYSKMIRAFLR